MSKRFSASRGVAVLLAIWLPASSLAQQQAIDPELEKGLRLVKQGEYGQAIIVLDPVATRLGKNPALKGQAAQAYLNLGIAYVGQGQEALASASFREAVVRDGTLQLNAFDISPKVRELFQKAKDDVAQQKAPVASEKKGGSKTPLIVLGVLAAGGGVALAASGHGGNNGSGNGGNSSATATIAAAQSTGLVGAPSQFAYVGNNCGNGTWDFGDGSTSPVLNPIVQHVYSTPGNFQIRLTLSNCGTASAAFPVKSLAGTWDARNATGETFVVNIAQTGSAVTGDADGKPLTGSVQGGGGNGFAVILRASGCTPGPNSPNAGQLNGTLDAALNTITGTGNFPCHSGGDVQQILTRR
jgi:hypothetical protein